jgi:hypothetical protein
MATTSRTEPPTNRPPNRPPNGHSLVMGTRAGDVDPAVPLHLMRTLGLTAQEMDGVLNKKSGLLGLCGDSDLRAVIERRAAGDPEVGRGGGGNTWGVLFGGALVVQRGCWLAYTSNIIQPPSPP